jgi:LmbE family N-acetylglucosaminyl deacetylase
VVLGDYRRAVLVAPHPDDEVLGCGGLMQHLAKRGVPLTVIAVTDGESSHPDSPTVTRTDLAAIRAGERRHAIEHLGVAAQVLRLGLPDGGVAVHTATLAARLCSLLAPEVLCVAPWEHDGHPDHDAVAESAIQACAASGATLLRFLIWTWHWATPGDPRVPWTCARQLPLSPTEANSKQMAIAAFASQIAPLSDRPGDETILPPAVVAYFQRSHEVFLQ